MTEMLLNAILNLFALISSGQGPDAGPACRRKVESYLTSHLRLSDPSEYLGLFDVLFDFALEMEPGARKQNAEAICENLKGKLPRQEQIIALMNLMLLLGGGSAKETGSSFAKIIASALDIDRELLESLALLTSCPEDHSRQGEDFLVLDSGSEPAAGGCKKLHRPDFKAGWTLLNIRETGALLLTPTGNRSLTINGQPAAFGHYYLIEPGAILRDAHGSACYYAEIAGALSGEGARQRISFGAQNLDFRFPGSENGLHDFSFCETSGRLIGVMGGSGAGKSTLLSILNGTLPPDSGRLTVNGLDLYKEPKALEGIIGYVPQDDLLFDDLTVYQNLYFSARLCLDNLSDDEIKARVDQTLTELDQLEIRDLKVGSPLEKTISGGQRKRLNIALELIRQPAILFADEPTSGLSSADSLNVMSLLKEQALGGRLVIAVIHQPSSAIFKLLDSLWILDKGGRPVYAGNPLDALVYFRSSAHLAGMDECACPACGNVNPEQIFEILDMREVDQKGQFTSERVCGAEDWHRACLAQWDEQSPGERAEQCEPPPRKLWKPSGWGQFKIFFTRNLLARLSNRQYVLINFLEAPIIAVVLALLCRFSPGDEYVFMDNSNISMFFFMSVIVAVFLGLSVSAEEIIKDRKILKREGFLRLSWLSYINSKAVYLCMVIAIQTLCFTLIAHAILQVPDMTFKVWAMLFSCGVCAAFIGLNISASLRSVVAIYILAPLLLIPQMLLGGSVISFNELVSAGAGHNNVPWYANVMPTRWGYEGLVTEQYSTNRFNRQALEFDCRIRQIDYYLDSYIPEIKSLADFVFIKKPVKNKDQLIARNLRVIKNEITEIEKVTGLVSGLGPGEFKPGAFDKEALKKLKGYLAWVGRNLRTERTAMFMRKSGLQKQRLKALGPDGVETLKKLHYNESISQTAHNSMALESLRISGDRIVQLDVPVCKPARSQWGMAHFAAGWKQVDGHKIPTYYFNLAFLWLLSVLLYLCLYFKLLPRLLKSSPTG